MKLTFSKFLSLLIIATISVAADLINLRISFRYVDAATGTDLEFNQKVKQALDVAKLFVSNLIKVNKPAIADDYIKPVKEVQCGGVSYAQSILDTGVAQQDLYIIAIDNVNQANIIGSFCDYPVPRPRFGYIKLDNTNEANSATDNQQIYKLIEKLIRAFLSILGFDSNLFSNFAGVTDVNTLFKEGKVAGKYGVKQLNLPNIKSATQKYFGCFDNNFVQGGPVEDFTSSSQIFTKWEATLLAEDIMSSQTTNQKRLRFSEIDVALLKDSGFFPYINESMIEPMSFGKGRGCEFYQNACSTTNSFQEFCQLSDSYKQKKCNIGQAQLGTCIGQENSNLNNCSIYQNNDCTSDEACLDFQSNYLDSKCYGMKVLSSSSTTVLLITVQPNKFLYQCTSNGQLLDSQPIIKCPADISQYIAQINQECPSNCSGKGYCNNGICYCLDGYFGNDCSTVSNGAAIQYSYLVNFAADATLLACPKGYSLSKTVKIKEITYNTCGCSLEKECKVCSRYACEECDLGYQLSSKNSYCVSCNVGTITNCAKCQLDPLDKVSQCIECYPGFFLKDNVCQANCTTGQYLQLNTDGTPLKCQNCLVGCASCKDKLQCQACKTGYNYDLPLDSPKGYRICYIQCTSTQAAIKDYTDPKFNVCQECSEGTGYSNCNTCHYEGTTKVCDTCNNHFKVSLVDKKCSECEESYFLHNNACEQCAQEHCIVCETYDTCKKCEDGYYVQNGKCVTDCGLKFFGNSQGVCEPCISDCDVCVNNNECIVCGNGKYYDHNLSKSGCTTSVKACLNCDRCSNPKGPQQDPPTDDTIKTSSCYTCKNSQVLIPFFEPSDQSKYLKSLQYYGTCKDFCIENQMQTPQPKYESQYNLCKYCDETNKCKKCNKEGGCSECINKLKYYLEPDLKTCVSWDLSCSIKDDVLGCLQCYNPKFVGFKNTCIKQCPENYDTVKEGENYYCKKIECFHSCKTCIGSSYNECLTCPTSRKLEVYHGSFFGQCSCLNDDYTDTFAKECEKNDDDLSYRVSTYFFASTALVSSVVSSAMIINPISFFFLSDHSQSVGQLTYVDKQNSYGLDTSMAAYKYFNLNILIPTPVVNQKLEQKRVLEGSINRILAKVNVNEFRETQNYSKIVDYHNSKNFIYAGFWSFIVLSIVWIIKAIGHLLLTMHEKKATPGGIPVETPKPSKWLYILEEYFMGLIPLGVYILTCSELTLLAFLDFRDSAKYVMTSKDGFDAVSVVFSALYLLFSSVYLLYLAFSPKEGIIYSLFDEYRNGSMFFFICLAAKKVISSILIVFLEGQPIGQIFSVVIVEAFFIFYLILVRPFKRETYYNMIYIGGELLVFIVTITYTIMSFTTDSTTSQNNCAQAIMIFLILLMIYHAIFAIFLIAFFFFKCCRKERQSQRYTAPSHDAKLQTETGMMKDINDIDLITAKNGQNNHSQLETNKFKNSIPVKHNIEHPIQEESSRGEASQDVPALFNKKNIPSTEQYPKDASRNSQKHEQDELDLVIEDRQDYNHPPYNSKRQENYKQQQKPDNLLQLSEGNENLEEDNSEKSYTNKVKHVPVFHNTNELKMAKNNFNMKDSPNYQRSSSQISENGLIHDQGVIETQNRDVDNGSRISQPYLEVQSSQTPEQSQKYMINKPNNQQQLANKKNTNQYKNYKQNNDDDEEDDGSQGYFNHHQE